MTAPSPHHHWAARPIRLAGAFGILTFVLCRRVRDRRYNPF
jgi:hypothetical protein